VIVLRADAGPAIGIGHVMRSLTLGRELVGRGVDVALATRDLPPALATRAERLGVPVIGIDDASADAFIMLDGYEIDAPAGRHGVIDDNREAPVGGAALVLNQNLHASPGMYADLAPATRLLLGPQYALLRAELEAVRATAPVREHATRVVLAVGGADPLGLTEPIARALESECELRVAVGAANPRRDTITALGVTLDAGDLVDSYAWADIAVIAAGTTLWEVAYLGLPAVAIVVADNQRAAAKAAEAAGFVTLAEPDSVRAAVVGLLADPARRGAMRVAGQAHFDGFGAARVADAVIEVARA
jgi:spore coat polysaccharide biosynthesis predicted glycosyltransferase SpsG